GKQSRNTDMTSSLKQMKISYEPREDRLLLKVSSSANHEFRVWLTRRFSALLLRVLREQLDKQGGSAEVASREQTRQQLKQGAFDQAYALGPQPSFPPGESGILAFRIQCSESPDGVLKPQLLPAEGRGVNLALDASMLYMLHSLLEQAVNSTDWQIAAPPP